MDKCFCWEITWRLISNNWFQFLRLSNHLFQFRKRRNTVAEVLFCIYFGYLGMEVGRNTVTEFLYGVYTSRFEQFCELSCNTVDAEEVSMVGPLQDKLFADACFFCQSSTALLGCTLFQQVFCSLYTGSLELFSIYCADTFDLFNFVSHNMSVKWLIFFAKVMILL